MAHQTAKINRLLLQFVGAKIQPNYPISSDAMNMVASMRHDTANEVRLSLISRIEERAEPSTLALFGAAHAKGQAFREAKAAFDGDADATLAANSPGTAAPAPRAAPPPRSRPTLNPAWSRRQLQSFRRSRIRDAATFSASSSLGRRRIPRWRRMSGGTLAQCHGEVEQDGGALGRGHARERSRVSGSGTAN